VTRVGFIGAGKMAEALISRLGSPQSIIASDISKKRLSYLKRKYKIKVAKTNLAVFAKAQIVILAVKPETMAEVLRELETQRYSNTATQWQNKLIISIAAGIPLNYLQKKLPGVPIVRAMPNNPCLVGMGITALTKGPKVSNAAFKKARMLFEKVGKAIEVSEKSMDAVTGLSGSGPAFIYLTIEAMIAAGCELKLDHKSAQELALQTVLGSAKTMLETGKSARELRKMVASPGGTTIEGLKVLEKGKFFHDLMGAVRAAAKKSKLLSRKWTK